MEKILFVGMDVHKDTISNAVLNGHDSVVPAAMNPLSPTRPILSPLKKSKFNFLNI